MGRFRVNSNTHRMNQMYRRCVISVKRFRHVSMASLPPFEGIWLHIAVPR